MIISDVCLPGWPVIIHVLSRRTWERVHVCLPAPLRETFILSTCGNALPQRRERAHSPRFIASAVLLGLGGHPGPWPASGLQMNGLRSFEAISSHSQALHSPSSFFTLTTPPSSATLHLHRSLRFALSTCNHLHTCEPPNAFFYVCASSASLHISTHSIHFSQAICHPPSSGSVHPPSSHYYCIAPSS